LIKWTGWDLNPRPQQLISSFQRQLSSTSRGSYEKRN
jgi:hypothetical protein